MSFQHDLCELRVLCGELLSTCHLRKAPLALMLRATLTLLIALAGAYLVMGVIMWGLQERIAFPAPRYALPSPQAAGIADAELVTLLTSDRVELRGWYLSPVPPPTDDSPSPALIWFYGNAEAVGLLAPLVRELRPPGMGVLLLDYRGYGESGGVTTERGLYRDADAAWRYLAGRADVDSTLISVYGRSLGAVLALYLADNYSVRSVILDSPFTSARDMAAVHYWYVPRIGMRLEMDNLSRAKRLAAPLAVFHGSDDDIALPWMGKAIADAGRAREYVVFQGAGHNDVYDVAGSEYRTLLHDFLASTHR